MWSRIRRRVLKSRNYEPQQNSQFRDLDEENDDINLDGFEKIADSSDGISRRMTNGFTKCLINNLNSNPISCACKRNVSPVDTPIPEDKSRVKDNDKSNSLTIGKNLNYYFKETDSCEVVRKNKSSSLSTGGKAQKSKVTGDSSGSRESNKKQDSHASHITSSKDKAQTLSIFSAGQRDGKSGIDFNEFHQVFNNSQESLVEISKTVTFETFGKPVPNQTDVKPPLFLPVKKKKKPAEDTLNPTSCESSLADGSLLSSSKGASLTSEEGVESGYGTQDDGNDRLARSVSSSSDSNAPDFIGDFNKSRCQISRDSTGEEEVFHHSLDTQREKANESGQLCPLVDNANRTCKPQSEARTTDGLPVTRNMNIVIAEVHAENFDEPRACNVKDLAMKQTTSGIKMQVPSCTVDNKLQNNHSNDNLASTGVFDINYNPAADEKTLSKNKHNDRVRQTSSAQLTEKLEPKKQEPSQPDSDSDDDIKEYLPADTNSMLEVYNSSQSSGKKGAGHNAADLYASVPRIPETEHVMQTITSPPSRTMVLTKDAKTTGELKLTEKRPSRPDLIDCHDRTPTPPRADSSDKQVSEPEDEHGESECGEDNVVISDDGDSGPPLPLRNYNQTLSRDSQTDPEANKQICEAPTLVIRQKSNETTSSVSSNVTRRAGVIDDADEIVEQEEPIHMSWDEVMKEAKSLGIPLNPPQSAHAPDHQLHRCSSSSSSQGTPVASPVVKRSSKVKRSQSESKKRSPFKDKIQSLFTLRRSKADTNKSVRHENKDESATSSRRSLGTVSYERGCSTMSQDHGTMHRVKSCSCGSRNEVHRLSSPQYTCYPRHSKHRCGAHHHHAPQHQPHHHMNVSINVSVISSSFTGAGNSPEVSIMTHSMDASLGDSPGACPSSPMSQSMIEGACYPGSPGMERTVCPGSPLSRSLMSAHSMSNQSIMSGQSAPSYYSSHSPSGQSPSMYQSSQSTGGQSAHSYHSAHSLGSPTTLPQRSTPTKGVPASPIAGSPLNGFSNSNHYGMNGTITKTKNGCYGDSYDNNYGSSNDGGGSNADFISSLLKLKDCGWYWGPLGWDEAENKLANKPDGSFLVRDSSDDRYILSLSFRSQGTTHHTRIEHYKGMFSFYSQPKSHGAATIVEFIEKAMEHSRSGKFLYFLRPRAPGLPPAPVQLLYPVSRLLNMQSLQHMCRFVILKQVRKDHIDRLPIPPRLKEYLKQNQYYTEYLGGEVTELTRY